MTNFGSIVFMPNAPLGEHMTIVKNAKRRLPIMGQTQNLPKDQPSAIDLAHRRRPQAKV